MLKKLFGVHLGTGDYGHLVIDHSAMLLRHFRSFYKYSGQGFEASHKLHRQLYSKATNHDSSGPGQSCELQDIVLLSSSLSSLSLLLSVVIKIILLFIVQSLYDYSLECVC